MLRDYMAYGKEHINPMLNDAATVRLVEAYVEMRRVGSGRGQVSAYPRQLESLIRLSEAHAKVRFLDVVEVYSVGKTYRLDSNEREKKKGFFYLLLTVNI